MVSRLYVHYFHSTLGLQNHVDLALSDLDTAIQLSGGHGKVAELAYTQRGLIRRLQGCDEGALEDFKAATKLGGSEAFSKLRKERRNYVIIMILHV